MKKFKTYILITGMLLFLSACMEDELLNQEPKGRLSDDVLKTSLTAAEEAVFGVYGDRFPTRNDGLWGRDLWALKSVASPYIESSTFSTIDLHSLTSSNSAVTNVWQRGYIIHNRASVVIESLHQLENEEVDDMGFVKKERLEGEVKFLRALMDYHLVKAFGNVPLPDKPLTYIEAEEIEQMSQEEGWDFIIQDLLFAADHLPAKSQYPPNELGRATSGAALTLLTKVYLNAGMFTEAMQTANEVITSGEYSLTTNQFGDWDGYYEIFRMRQENGPGSIFEWQQAVASDHLMTDFFSRNMTPIDMTLLSDQSTDLYDTVGYNGSDPILVKDTLTWGDRIQLPADQKSISNWQEGVQVLFPSQYLLQQFTSQPSTDPRQFISVLEDGSFYPDYGVIWGESALSGLAFGKYIGTMEEKENNILFGWWWGENIPVLRYADLLLMYAEAAALANTDLGGAVNMINLVRARASNSDFPIDPRPTVGLTQDQVLDWVRTERILELSTEGYDFFDLQRYAQHHPGWNWMDEMQFDERGGDFFDPGVHDLFPIPQREMDLGNYVQNPGY